MLVSRILVFAHLPAEIFFPFYMSLHTLTFDQNAGLKNWVMAYNFCLKNIQKNMPILERVVPSVI